MDLGKALRGFMAVAALLLAPWPALAQAISPSLVVTRTSGVAPLAVTFDATRTTHTNGAIEPFRDLEYDWDFGDPTSGTWAFSGQPKNVARGPVAAHVFDQPGSYTVQLTVRDPSGGKATKSVTVSVSDPDVVYGGTNTICVSTGTTFTGCPAGASHVTATDFGQAWAQVANGKRVLLRRGDLFPTTGKFSSAAVGPVTLGAFGSGAKPIVELRAGIGTDPLIKLGWSKSQVVSDWRIMDLDFHSNMFNGERVVNGGSRVENILVYRVDAENFPNGMSFYGSNIQYWGIAPHEGVFIVENHIDRNKTNGVAAAYPITFSGVHSAVLGTLVTNVSSPTHLFRADIVKQSVISHNDFQNPDPTRACIKMHAASWSKGYGYTEENVVSYNRLNGGATNWITAFAPQNVSSDERVRRILIESNYLTVTAGGNGRTGMYIAADETTVRNNVFNFTGDGASGTCVVFTRRGVEPAHFGNQAYNNTCYDGDAGQGIGVVNMGTTGGLVDANLAVAANPSAGTGGVSLTSSPFAGTALASFGDFSLKAGSAPVDAAGVGTPALYDALGAKRIQDGDGDGVAASDAGAFELAGSGGGSTLTPPAAPVLLP